MSSMSDTVNTDATDSRQADHDIERLLIQRWSPRAMSPQPMRGDDLNRLFEAARWAPSSYNIQPWRFIYGLRPSQDFTRLLDALVDQNFSWAADASAIIVITSLTINPNNGKPAPTHRFDTGAAWMNLALQGSAMGLVIHGMAGFDKDKVAEIIQLPPNHSIEAMAAIGYPGEVEDLPNKLQGKEEPSQRKPIEAFTFAGHFPKDSQG